VIRRGNTINCILRFIGKETKTIQTFPQILRARVFVNLGNGKSNKMDDIRWPLEVDRRAKQGAVKKDKKQRAGSRELLGWALPTPQPGGDRCQWFQILFGRRNNIHNALIAEGTSPGRWPSAPRRTRASMTSWHAPVTAWRRSAAGPYSALWTPSGSTLHSEDSPSAGNQVIIASRRLPQGVYPFRCNPQITEQVPGYWDQLLDAWGGLGYSVTRLFARKA